MLIDYGESHYIGPIKGAQPNSEAWVNGFDHTAWLHLCGYFAHLFKYERRIPSEPTADIVPNEDRVFVWARPHPRDAEAYADPVGRPRGWELVRTISKLSNRLFVDCNLISPAEKTEDIFWVVVLSCAPAHVVLWCARGDDNCLTPGDPVQNSGSMSINRRIPAGLSLLSCPLIPGAGIGVQIIRRSDIVLDFHPHNFIFEASPKTFNFNAYVWMYPKST